MNASTTIEVPVTAKLRRWLVANGHCAATDSTEEMSNKAACLYCFGGMTAEQFHTLTETEEEIMSPNPEKVFANRGSRVRVKDPSEGYSTKRYAGLHQKTGEAILNPFTGRQAEYASEMEHAKTGVLLKCLGSA